MREMEVDYGAMMLGWYWTRNWYSKRRKRTEVGLFVKVGKKRRCRK